MKNTAPRFNKVDYTIRILRIDWSKYETVYGVADNVPDYLIDLAADDETIAIDASYELWCGLCHQHAYVSSAAVPAYPFILEILHKCDTNPDTTLAAKLRTELLDIMAGFANCTQPEHPEAGGEFQQQLRKLIKADKDYFRSLIDAEGANGYPERIWRDLQT